MTKKWLKLLGFGSQRMPGTGSFLIFLVSLTILGLGPSIELFGMIFIITSPIEKFGLNLQYTFSENNKNGLRKLKSNIRSGFKFSAILKILAI